MGKWWSYLFGLVLFACAASLVWAPLAGYWLPEGVSTHSWDVDKLFYFILIVTGFFYFLTEGLLVWFIWRFAGYPLGAKEAPDAGEVPATVPQESVETLQPTWFGRLMKPVARVLHDQHRVEMAWTLVPALILLYIAFAQIGAWVRIKYESRQPNEVGEKSALQVEVIAHQFGWRMRYPNPARLESWRKGSWEDVDGKESPTKKNYRAFGRNLDMDDVVIVNELHTWVGQPVLVHLSTRDVLHSFNLPHMRVKQDALPGRVIPVWFTPTKSNTRVNPHYKELLAKGQYQEVIDKGELGEVWEDGFNPVTGKVDQLHVWDLACAELCGWGHYRMIGRLYVHPNYKSFQDWLQVQYLAQHGRKAEVGK